jgi:hypothetical protein
VPWGIINSNYNVDRNDAVQQLTVTTNAPTGYNVYAEENDQMGKDGAPGRIDEFVKDRASGSVLEITGKFVIQVIPDFQLVRKQPWFG